MRSQLFVSSWLLAAGSLLATPAVAGEAGQSPPAEKSPAPDDVAELRRELASLREEYVGRIAALESRLQALESGRTAPATPEPGPAPPPQEAAPAVAPVYGGGGAASKVFNPDIAVVGNFLGAAGQSPERPAVAQLQEAELVPGDRRSVRARRFLPDLRPRRGRRRGRLHHLPDGARRPAAEGRQDARRLRQGRRDAHPRAAVDRSAARHAEPHRRRGRARRLWRLDLATDPEPDPVPRSDRPGLPRRVGDLQGAHAERSRLRRPPARLPRPGRVDQPRSRRLLRQRRQRRDRRLHDAALGRRRHVPLQPLRRAIYRPARGQRARLEQARGHGAARRPSASTPRPSTSSRAAGSPACATTTPIARTTPTLTDKGGSFFLTYWPSEFSQIRGQYRRTRFGEAADAPTSSCSSSCSPSAPTAPTPSREVS